MFYSIIKQKLSVKYFLALKWFNQVSGYLFLIKYMFEKYQTSFKWIIAIQWMH